jgi:hypothetical protein
VLHRLDTTHEGHQGDPLQQHHGHRLANTSQAQLLLCVPVSHAAEEMASSIHSELQCVALCQMVHVASNSVKIGGAQIFSCIVMSEFLTALAGSLLISAKFALTIAQYSDVIL